MAYEGEKRPLLAGSVGHTPQTNQIVFPRKRRFHRCKSAPSTELVPPQKDDHCVLKDSESIFDIVHPSFKRVFMFLVVYLGLGTICFYLVDDQITGLKTNGILDAVYFCIVTMTTVGYGDLVPNSILSKLLACVFVFSGMALICLILSNAADYLVEKQEILLVKALHMNQKVGQLDMLRDIETNRVRYKCFIVIFFLLVLMTVGTTFLATAEKLDLVDAFYCVCSTITSLGYGDKSFSTEAGRIFAIFWILTSTICLAQFFFCIAEVSTENRRKAFAKWVLTRKLTNLDLEAADLDQDGDVGAAEFILYKLKEMGKINHEDISVVMEEFENIDIDDSGTLSHSDIILGQSSQTER